MEENKLDVNKNKRTQQALFTAVSAAVATTATAQNDNSKLAIEEVVVTASKREANLQDLAQSIQAFTGDDIEKRGFSGIDDYAKQIPSLAFARREPGGTSVIFRGVAASGIQFGTNPTAAVYLDEQAITSAGANPDPKLIDIERIEALSGPQGTLFGAASQSGVLRLITNKPDTSEAAGWVAGSMGSVENGGTDAEVSGMYNLPLTDSVAVRLVGYSTKDAGYIDNVMGYSQGGTFTNEHLVREDVNSGKTSGGRAAIRWETDRVTTDLMYTTERTKVRGFGDVNLTKFDENGDEVALGDLQQVRFNEESYSENWEQLGLTVEADLGFADLTVAASRFERDFSYEVDSSDYLFEFQRLGDEWRANGGIKADGSKAFCYYYACYSVYDFGGDADGIARQQASDTRDAVEVRLASPADGSRWNWVVGAFYANNKSNTVFDSDSAGWSDTPGGAYINYAHYYYNGEFLGESDNFFAATYDQEITQKAVFGEISADLTDRLNLTVGARWFDEDREFELIQGSLRQGEVLDRDTDHITTDGLAKSSHDGWVPKVNLSYTLDDDKMVYATYSEGFRSGGSNPVRDRSLLPRSYEPDVLHNYEMGAKTNWMDNRLRLNVAAYHMTWEDIQVQVTDPSMFQQGTINFPSAEINGIEVDAMFIPAEGWTLSGNFAYNDAKVAEDAEMYGENIFGDDELIISVSKGARLPITPEFKASASAQYDFNQQALGADQYVRVDYSYTGDSVNSLEGGEAAIFGSVYTHAAFSVVDLKYALEADDWTMGVSLKNALDERGEQFMSNRWGKGRLSINKPRTLSFDVKYHF